MKNSNQSFPAFLLLIVFVLIIGISSFGQNIGINGTGAAPNASAILDVTSNNKGLLIPRISIGSTLAGNPIANPANSLLVYNTNAGINFGSGTGFYYWDGIWTPLGGSGWSLTGDAGTTPGTNFIGTTDAKDWVIKTNNTEEMRILSNGNVGIGIATPLAELHLSQPGGNGGTPTNDWLYDGAGEVAHLITIENAHASLGLVSQAECTVGFDCTLAAANKKQMAFEMVCEFAMLGGDESWLVARSLTDVGGNAAGNILTMSATGNTCVGGRIDVSSNPTAKYVFGIKNGTAPSSSLSNGTLLYAEDVAASSELKVRDEAGNVTTLSPHNFSLIPSGASDKLSWAYYSEHSPSEKVINVDMLKLTRLVEKLSGENLVHTANLKNKDEDGTYSKIDKITPIQNSLVHKVNEQNKIIEDQTLIIKELIERIENLEAKK